MATKTLESNRLLLVNVADGEAENISASYSFKYSNNVLLKFIKSVTTENNVQKITYSYLPETLTVDAQLIVGDPIENIYLECYGYYKNVSNGSEQKILLAVSEDENSVHLEVPFNNFTNKNF